MLAWRTLGDVERKNFYRGSFKHAGFLALTATSTVLGVHHRNKQGMLAGARIDLLFERDGFIDGRADAVAHVAAQAEEVEAVLLIDQYRQAHPGLVDVGELMIQRASRTGLDARNVLAHLARQSARDKVWRAGRYRFLDIGQIEDFVRTIAHA